MRTLIYQRARRIWKSLLFGYNFIWNVHYRWCVQRYSFRYSVHLARNTIY